MRSNRFLIGLVLGVLGICTISSSVTRAADVLTAEDFVGSMFASVSADDGSIVIEFRADGPRYLVELGGEEARVCSYGEVIRVTVGTRLRIAGKAVEFELTTLPKEIVDYGFAGRLVIDNRSVGGARSEKTGYLLFAEKVKDWSSTSPGFQVDGLWVVEASDEIAKLIGLPTKSED